MKYALLVAMALLGACASDADTVDEAASNTSASPEVQAPVDGVAPADTTTTAETESDAGSDGSTPAKPAPRAVPELAPALGHTGSWVMSPQTDSNKPQPQPWMPADQPSIVVNDPAADQARNIR